MDLKGKDPDDALSSIPYEKGYAFLSYPENQVGKDKWNKLIPHYFTTFARRSLDSYDFKSKLLSFFESDSTASDVLDKVDWYAWFYNRGLPPKQTKVQLKSSPIPISQSPSDLNFDTFYILLSIKGQKLSSPRLYTLNSVTYRQVMRCLGS